MASTSDEGIQDEEVKSPARPESQNSLEQKSHEVAVCRSLSYDVFSRSILFLMSPPDLYIKLKRGKNGIFMKTKQARAGK